MPSFMMATTILLMFQMITLEILNNSRVTVGIVYFKNIARFSWTTITIHVLVIIVDTSAFLLDSWNNGRKCGYLEIGIIRELFG